MGMPLEMNWIIVTKGNETRTGNGNEFTLTKEGYRMYPLNIPLQVKQTTEGRLIGEGVIKKLTWENDHTYIDYHLTKLDSIN